MKAMQKTLFRLALAFVLSAVPVFLFPSGPFVRRKGSELFLGNDPIRLRGVCFGNMVWQDEELPDGHHSRLDYGRVRSWGMNAVRFYMNYKTFEDDMRTYRYKEEGFLWLDQNIAWAKENGVYLILNMHVPQGGFQSMGEGAALWNNPENRRRLAALWKKIAERYRDEPVIAAYDILNEPYPTQSARQWKDLAFEIVKAIREADTNHLCIVERAMGVVGKSGSYDDPENYFLVDDANTAYTFHFYFPSDYCFQGWGYLGFGDGGKYPDETRLSLPPKMEWLSATFDNPRLAAGNSDWKKYEGAPFMVTNPGYQIAMPVLRAFRNSGKAAFGDFEITETDASGKRTRQIMKIRMETGQRWTLWSENQSGSLEVTTGAGALVSGSTADAAAFNPDFAFLVKQGFSYRLSGLMKGGDIPAGAECQFRIDFYRNPSGEKILPRGRELLERELKRSMEFGRSNRVPVYVGEFGADAFCFTNRKGGLNWVSDVIDLFDQYGLHYTYHAYHEGLFGIFRNDNGLPDEKAANTGLIDLFKKKNSGKR